MARRRAGRRGHVCGLLLAGAQILPMLELAARSARAPQTSPCFGRTGSRWPLCWSSSCPGSWRLPVRSSPRTSWRHGPASSRCGCCPRSGHGRSRRARSSTTPSSASPLVSGPCLRAARRASCVAQHWARSNRRALPLSRGGSRAARSLRGAGRDERTPLGARARSGRLQAAPDAARTDVAVLAAWGFGALSHAPRWSRGSWLRFYWLWVAAYSSWTRRGSQSRPALRRPAFRGDGQAIPCAIGTEKRRAIKSGWARASCSWPAPSPSAASRRCYPGARPGAFCSPPLCRCSPSPGMARHALQRRGGAGQDRVELAGASLRALRTSRGERAEQPRPRALPGAEHGPLRGQRRRWWLCPTAASKHRRVLRTDRPWQSEWRRGRFLPAESEFAG